MVWLNRVQRAWDRVLAVCAAISAITLFVLAMMVTVDVAVRYFTGRPLTGVFEVSRVLLLLITFMALGPVQRENAQLQVDAFRVRLRGAPARAATGLAEGLSLAAFGILLWSGSDQFMRAWTYGYVEQGLVQIPKWIPFGFLLLGCAVVAVTIVLKFAWLISGRDEPSPVAVPAASPAEKA